MLQTRVIPCLLLSEGRLVKTVKFKKPDYVGDPINAIRIYNEMEVDEIVVLDIDATKNKEKPPFQLISEVASECFMPMCYGGAVRDLEDIRTIFGLGIEKVAINSYAFEDPDFIRRAADRFGSQSIVASIDVKRGLFGGYTVYTRGGSKSTSSDPISYAKKLEELGAGEMFLTSIDRDGTWSGYDLDLIKRVTDAVNVPVIASGGAGCVEDFVKAVKEAGASAVAAGSMVVYQGKDLGVLVNFPKRHILEQALS